MMKFFRKYNKHLLAVFMALLLVVWLGGQAFENLFMPNPANTPIGTAIGRELLQGDLNGASREVTILQNVGLPWQKPWIGNASQARLDFHPELNELDWLLLRLEADQLGLGVTPSQVESFKQGSGFTPNDIDRLASRLNVSVATIDAAIASFLRVRSSFGEVQSAIFVSDPELRTIARDVGETVTVRWIGLPAAAFVDESEVIDEPRIVEHFEKWKDKLPGEGDLGAGFRHPDRVEIEYVSANADAVMPTITVARDEAKAYWQTNQTRFLRPEPESADTQPVEEDAATQPTESQPAESQAAEPTEPPYYETFMEAEADVVAELRKNRAPIEAQRLLNELLATQVLGDWDRVETDPKTGFVPAPEGVKSESFLADRVARFVASKPAYAGVFEVHRTPLMSADELRKLDGIGSAAAPMASESAFIMQESLIANDAFDVQGLVESALDRFGARQPLSMYQFSPKVYRDDDGNAYTYRVVRVVPSAPPQSLDEVRDKVVQSLRIATAFSSARATASELLIKSEDSGLKVAWQNRGDLDLRITELKESADGPTQAWGEQIPPAFARSTYTGDPTVVLGIQSEDLINAAFDAAQNFDRTTQTKPLTVVELPEYQLILVMEIDDFKPMYEEDYQARKDRDKRFITMRRNQDLIANWFDAENIRKRVNYQPPA